jgi:uncharacterized protein YgiB involved in biofilm formation
MSEMNPTRPAKRSKRVVLTTLAAGAAAVTGCGESSNWGGETAVDATPFASLAECQAAGIVPASTCQAAYAEAQGNHEQAAPRFETQGLCEEEFGQGQCQPRVAGNSSYFIPILGGFMVGRMLGRDNRSYYGYGGLYRSRRHNGWYAGGPTGGPLQRSGSGWRAGASAFDRPTAAPAVRSRSSQSASRGGFGGRSRSGAGG